MYDVYGMHKSSFITGKVAHRLMADNHKFLSLGTNMPQRGETYKYITERLLRADAEKKARLRKARGLASKEPSMAPSKTGRSKDASKAHTLLDYPSKQGKEKGASAATGSDVNSVGTLDQTAGPTKEPPEASLLAPSKAKGLEHMQTHSFRNGQNQITEVTLQSEAGVTADEKAGGEASGRFAEPLGSIVETLGASSRPDPPGANLTDQAQLRRLVRGERATGRFAQVKLEEGPERESCVIRLGDVKSRGNRMDGWSWNRVSKAKDAEDDDRRRERLDAKMHHVVKTVRRGLVQKDAGERNLAKFEAVVEELGRASVMAPEKSLQEPSWDIHEHMKREKAKFEYARVAEASLRKKLVRLGRIQREDELEAIDSIIESAYNSKKQLLWG